ncbi:MAG TPA: hypothetical protein VKM54_21990, partial [Myxococcota bacterium]|nr:hypothetical protein [Myxococcota bacterium]
EPERSARGRRGLSFGKVLVYNFKEALRFAPVVPCAGRGKLKPAQVGCNFLQAPGCALHGRLLVVASW